MQKDNNIEENQDKKLFSFTPNLLTNIQSFDAKRLNEISLFFSTAFRELTNHELFNDEDYRLEWADNICILESMAIPYKDYSNQEMETAIKTTMIILSERKEVANA
ncbi:hypothetical protein [uncultured Flavobacterium sp.]|uniref:hypothetical protein n=1 Tax=uncultured Flavobacterium sp. TaxID=165435 RepID=UPI0030ED9C13